MQLSSYSVILTNFDTLGQQNGVSQHAVGNDLRQDVELRGETLAQRCDGVALDKIVGPQPAPLAVDQPSLTQQTQVVRNSWLLDGQRSLQVADADIPITAR